MITKLHCKLAMPKPEYWVKSELLLNTLDGKLFYSDRISGYEAKQYYTKFYDLITNNKLSVDTISLFEQRLLPYLMFPIANNSNDYLIKLDKCWSQVQKILLNRFDTQTIERLCEKASLCNTSLVPNLTQVITNLEYILINSKSIRLQKTHSKLKIETNEHNQLMSWFDSIQSRSVGKQIAVFRSFERFSKAEFSDAIMDKALFLSRNNFWKYYFANDLVKQSALLVSQKYKSRAQAYFNNIIVLDDACEDELGLMFHVGDTVIIEWANPGGFHYFKESWGINPDFKSLTIEPAALQKGDFIKHRANAYNYWQYRIGFLLRSSTGVQPSRSDYQIKSELKNPT